MGRTVYNRDMYMYGHGWVEHHTLIVWDDVVSHLCSPPMLTFVVAILLMKMSITVFR